MKRRQQHAHCMCDHTAARGTGDRPGAQWVAGTAAALVIWKLHHFGMPALAGAAGAYLLTLILIHLAVGGARR
jgi:hypothetical protein